MVGRAVVVVTVVAVATAVVASVDCRQSAWPARPSVAAAAAAGVDREVLATAARTYIILVTVYLPFERRVSKKIESLFAIIVVEAYLIVWKEYCLQPIPNFNIALPVRPSHCNINII